MKKKKKKKPYKSPSFESEQVIETATLACGKCEVGGPTGSQFEACIQLRQNS